MTQLHYLFTDVCGGMAHCHACHTHIRLLIFLRSDSANRHILGCGHPVVGPMTHKLKLGRDFCTTYLNATAKFHHPTFNRLEVITLTNKLTNKQMPMKTSTSLRYAAPVGNKQAASRLHMVSSPYTLQWAATYPSKLALPMTGSGPHLIHGS